MARTYSARQQAKRAQRALEHAEAQAALDRMMERQRWAQRVVTLAHDTGERGMTAMQYAFAQVSA